MSDLASAELERQWSEQLLEEMGVPLVVIPSNFGGGDVVGPFPAGGDWKSLVLLLDGGTVAAVPIDFPPDPTYGLGAIQAPTDQPRVAGVVLDEQNFCRRVRHRRSLGRQLHHREPEILNFGHHAGELQQIDRLYDVAVGMEVI